MKKIVAVAFIAIFVTLIAFKGPTAARADYGDHDGSDPGYPNDCWYCMCDHSAEPFSPLDTWTAIGPQAFYDTVNEWVGFRYASWTFEAASMGSYNPYGPMQCDQCVNYYNGQGINSNDYEWSYSGSIYCYRAYYTYFGGPYSPDLNSVEAECLAGFQDPNNTTHIWYQDSYTIPWDFLNAHE